MFAWLKPNPMKKLRKAYDQKLEQAMFAQRMVHLRQFVQADLLIPADLANCSVSEFCLFINRQRLNFTQENNG